MCGSWVFKLVFRALGFRTSPRKDQSPTTGMVILGSFITVNGQFAQADAMGERIEKLNANIEQALVLDLITQATPIKLRGKLGFYTSLLEEKIGRGTTSSLIHRQYNRRTKKLPGDIRRNLIWWYSAVGKFPPRRAPMNRTAPIGAHTDAQGWGLVAAAVFDKQTVSAPSRLPMRSACWREVPMGNRRFTSSNCARKF